MTTLDEELEKLSTDHLVGGERMNDGSLAITHNWTTFKPAILEAHNQSKAQAVKEARMQLLDSILYLKLDPALRERLENHLEAIKSDKAEAHIAEHDNG